MRNLLALALVLAACSRSERPDDPSASDSPSVMAVSGSDRLLVRFARAGGSARVFAYPEVDSLIWTSPAPLPALERVLGFDSEAGSVVALDTRGVPLRVDLRLGAVARETRTKLAHVVSQDGNAIYGVASDGTIRRLTPTGEWRFKPPAAPRDLFPQSDGGLLVVADTRNGTTVWRMHPPQESLTDTARLPTAQRALGTPLGDRLYFTVDSGLIGVRARDLSAVPSVRLPGRIRAAVTAPSGDRIYLLTAGSPELVVVDRYAEEIATRISLPDTSRDLRMDPTGRYVLARAARGDSVWVVAVATDRLVGRVGSGWRADLPLVTPDGALALLRGNDVTLVNGDSLDVVRRIRGGGRDLWHFIEWNGFRPRAASLDEPVQFEGMDTVPVDSGDTLNPFASAPPPDSLGPFPDTVRQTGRPDTTPPRTPAPPPVSTAGFTVQFAALRSEAAAHSAAGEIEAEGQRAHVVRTTQGGFDIWRVVLGPYSTREAAERAARSTGRSYWIYEGRP
ncbi:MAG: SPOR domain-containing protein [Gemmatimonadaceae bacterium]